MTWNIIIYVKYWVYWLKFTRSPSMFSFLAQIDSNAALRDLWAKLGHTIINDKTAHERKNILHLHLFETRASLKGQSDYPLQSAIQIKVHRTLFTCFGLFQWHRRTKLKLWTIKHLTATAVIFQPLLSTKLKRYTIFRDINQPSKGEQR